MDRPRNAYIAALPMYDFDELAAFHDSLWTAIASRLAGGHITGIPSRLSRELDHVAAWSDPRLLLGQACEFPLAKTVGLDVRVVATPIYAAPGCEGSQYRSAIVVGRDHPAACLADLRGSRCVVNAVDSNSGMNLLRASIAPLARDARGHGARFFQSVMVSGAHRRSAEMIVGGAADVAALDCVTFAHLQRLRPDMMSRLRVLDWTPSSPSLPFITAGSASDDTLETLRCALTAAVSAPELSEARARLYLVGVDVHPDPSFTEVLRLEREAVEHGYPVLA